MNWSDQGIVLSTKRYGESSLIVYLMTFEHGLHAGLVRSGSSKRSRGTFEPGNILSVNWQARLEEHLGSFRCELLDASTARFINHPMKLAVLSSACAVTEVSLPEREPYPNLFTNLRKLLDGLSNSGWLFDYVFWEKNLLTELGFGLDLSCCAVSGRKDQLIYVSPRSGRAVSKTAGEPYHSKMLLLPDFLLSDSHIEKAITYEEILLGLIITGHFLTRHVFSFKNIEEPYARTRFIDRLKQKTTIYSGG